MMKEFLNKACNWSGIPPYILRNNLIELKMLSIRLYNHLPLQKKRLKKIKQQSAIKLNFGCGLTKYNTWINIDSFFAKNVDLVLDLRRSLPFNTNSIDYCYSEHFLEHLYPEEGLRHLSEVHRILKPGGIYRVVVPAGIRFVEKYLSKDKDFFKLAFPWEERPMDAIFNILNWHGEHKNIFDFEQLEYVGKKSGFSMVKECNANSSSTLELRIDKSDPQRIAESLYVEFNKI